MFLRIVRVLLSLILILVIVVAGAAVYLIRSPFSKTDGQIAVAGPQAAVTVYRDEWGVPHIYADDEHDLFFAQGYVHAQDRLWQMDFQRRVGAGALSEVLGESTLETDRFLRTLGTQRAAQRDLALLSPQTMAALEAYAAGVNAYIESHRSRLPLEFRLLGYQPEPWQPLHSVVWSKMMAWSLGGNYDLELFNARLIERLGVERATDLLADYPDQGPFIVPPEVKSYGGLQNLDLDRAVALKRFLKSDGPDIGSNNWVVAGSRTQSGQPLLANDTHLGMQMPSVWYENGLHADSLEATGLSFPGAPGVVVGHNGRIAWGVTNVNPDIEDLFIEKINPDNPDQYEFEGAWRDMEIIEERIQVKGREEPLVERVRITHHGPIMNAVLDDLGQEAPPLALRWTALDGDRLPDAVLGINRAQNFDELRNALRHWVIAAQNFVYADVEGNIGYQMTGNVPIRAAGNGLTPAPGWTGQYEWTGYIPFEELPWVFNPATDYVVTANNQVTPDEYPYLISTDWGPPYRAQRIIELIESQAGLTANDFAAIQGDVHPPTADIFLPLLEGLSFAAGSREQQALALVLDWDRNMDEDSAAALIFEQFYLELARHTLGDDLVAVGAEDLATRYVDKATRAYSQTLARLATQPDSPWWDDQGTTDRVETQADTVQRAFQAAVEALQALAGNDPTRWRWGDVHQANFDHPLGAVAPLDRIFNRHIAARGSAYTVNAAAPTYPTFEVNHGASFRFIVDLGDLAGSRVINTTGQSGQVFHRHYGDMIEHWQGLDYHPLRFGRADVEAAAVDVLVLQPAGR